MSSDNQPAGCGAPATKIAYRGAVKRRFQCDDEACAYTGRGRVIPYATDVEGVTPPAGTHTGPARICGEEIGGE